MTNFVEFFSLTWVIFFRNEPLLAKSNQQEKEERKKYEKNPKKIKLNVKRVIYNYYGSAKFAKFELLG